jgi:hypothetical protein
MADEPNGDRRRHNLSNRARRSVAGRRARKDQPVRRVDIDRDIVITAMAVLILLLGVLAGVTLYQQRIILRSQDDINTSQNDINESQAKITANQVKIRRQQVRLERLERRDRLNAYQTAYRFCQRIDVDRAALHSLVNRSLQVPNPERRFILAFKRKIESKKGMPILDCEPNVSGGPAAFWPPPKQRNFVRRWEDGDLTAAEIGICRVRINQVTRPRACLKP